VAWVPETAPPEVLTYNSLSISGFCENSGATSMTTWYCCGLKRIVDVRYLRLGERISERIVDLDFREPQLRGAVAVHDQVGLEAPRLQIRVHVGNSGMSCNAVRSF